MSNRALMVGINKYPGAPLNGCVNDIQDMAKYLVSHCGFKSSEIRLLTDERATTQAILLRLHDLVSGLKAGDRVLFHYSGHGAQTAIRGSNGIPTRMADVICPVDFDWSSQRMITDTQFHDIFKLIPAGVDFTWVSDSCHSGDLSLNKGAMNVRSKNYPVPVDIAWRVQSAHDLGLAPTGMAPPQATPLNLAFVSGCGSKQTSADAFFGGRYNGACTYYLLHELNKPLSNPLTAIVGNMVNDLHTDGYDQKPELHGLDALKNRPFLA